MKLTDNEKRDIVKLIEEGKNLPDHYRFLLFDQSKQIELTFKECAFSTKGNLEMLKRAGFKDVSVIGKFICFEVIWGREVFHCVGVETLCRLPARMCKSVGYK